MRNMRVEILSGVEKEQGVRIGKLVLTKTRTKRLILGIHVIFKVPANLSPTRSKFQPFRCESITSRKRYIYQVGPTLSVLFHPCQNNTSVCFARALEL